MYVYIDKMMKKYSILSMKGKLFPAFFMKKSTISPRIARLRDKTRVSVYGHYAIKDLKDRKDRKDIYPFLPDSSQ